MTTTTDDPGPFGLQRTIAAMKRKSAEATWTPQFDKRSNPPAATSQPFEISERTKRLWAHVDHFVALGKVENTREGRAEASALFAKNEDSAFLFYHQKRAARS